MSDGKRICPTCNGTGKTTETHSWKTIVWEFWCRTCGGSGRV